MRSAVLQLPSARTADEKRKVLRTAIRQLERAEIYLVAIAYLELDDAEAERAVNKLRTDADSLRRYLAGTRSALRG